MKKYIAVDLGASNGRVIVGDLETIDVISRFETRNVRVKDSIYWDILFIYASIKEGLKKAFKKYGDQIAGIGIDTWGVDYALLDENGDILGNPYHYRDDRTEGAIEDFFKIIPREEVYKETGIQFMPFNTLFQLHAARKARPDIFNHVKHYLSVPDLLNYWLTGIMKNEYSHLSTTQLLNPETGNISSKLIDELGIKPDVFPELVMPGTILGPLTAAVKEELGAPESVVVIEPGCHDTASAVAAVPVIEGSEGKKNYAYLSSGTWSLLGIESDTPIINEASLSEEFTNEGSVSGGIRFLKNIMGLWIIQECKRAWDSEGQVIEWAEIVKAAEAAEDKGFRIDVDDALFYDSSLTHGSMNGRIQKYCRENSIPVPETVGEIASCVFRSLAEAYKRTVRKVEKITGNKIEELYIIGGGCQNDYLNRLTVEALGIPVFAGPVEATALGNILVQAKAMGDIVGLSEGRKMIAENFDVVAYKK
ncbi:MAG: rhamnulokinase [Spirochaetales bacterium]|nr:rhamnulokinase [Spirochaetales bacterium]